MIRLGIIGCGAIVQGQHIRAIRQNRAFALCGIVDPDPNQAADGFARWLGIEVDRVHGNHRQHPQVVAFLQSCYFDNVLDLLRSSTVDAVLIATPNYTHETIATQCLHAGVHVVCEKPVAFSVEAHDQLEKLAAVKNRVFQVGLVFRYSDVFRHTQRLLQEPQMGTPLMMMIQEFRPFAFQEWRYSKAISGGMFIEKNCHHFDLFNWFTGDNIPVRRVAAFGGQAVLKDQPKEVWCLQEKKVLPASDVIDHAWVIIEYDNGTKAQLGISFFCPWGREFRVGLIGEDWKIDVYEMERLLYVHRDATMKEQRFPPDPTGTMWQSASPQSSQEQGFVHSGAVQQWIEFAECIQHATEPFCNLRKARESIRLALAADQALAEGKVIECNIFEK